MYGAKEGAGEHKIWAPKGTGHAVPHDLADGGAGGVRASGRRRKHLLSRAHRKRDFIQFSAILAHQFSV